MPYKPRLVVLVSKSFGHAARQIVFPEKIDATEDTAYRLRGFDVQLLAAVSDSHDASRQYRRRPTPGRHNLAAEDRERVPLRWRS